MPKRRLILGILACGVLAVGLCAVLLTSREPAYQGQSLTRWAVLYSKKLPGSEQTPEAIRHIGTNAVPYLLDWIGQPRQPAWQMHLGRMLKWLPPRLKPQRLTSQDPRYVAAFDFFAMLGPLANSAVPELARRAQIENDSFISYNAMAALALLGREGFPPLFAALTNPNQNRTVRHNITAMMRHQGTNARPAIHVLVEFLTQPDTDLARISADTLGFLGMEPAIVVPALVTNLHHTDGEARASAAMALGRFGKDARQAVAPLSLLLTDTYLRCRREATNALRAISPAALTNAPPATTPPLP